MTSMQVPMASPRGPVLPDPEVSPPFGDALVSLTMKSLDACTCPACCPPVRGRVSRALAGRPAYQSRACLQLCLAVVLLCAARFSARAQPTAPAANASNGTPPSVLLFPVADKSGKNNADLDKALRKAVAEAVPAKLLDTSRKKLTDAQTSAHCADRSADCLRAISQQLGASILLAPSLDRGPDDLVLNILVFDGREAGKINEVAHWQDGTKLSQETVRALPQLIRGLFEPKPVEPPPEPVATIAPDVTPAPPPPAAVTANMNLTPLIPPLSVLGAGVVMLGAGLVTGAIMRGTEDEYNAKEVHTRQDAQAAADLLSTAKTEATIAKVCFGVSAVAIAAGGAWLSYQFFGKSKSEREVTRVAPFVSPQHVGFVVRYQGGSL
jgi:hypothetical protein